MGVGLNLKSGFIYNQLNEAPESSGWWGHTSSSSFSTCGRCNLTSLQPIDSWISYFLDALLSNQVGQVLFHILMSIKYNLWVKAVSQACCLCWSTICKQHHSKFSLQRSPPTLCKHPFPLSSLLVLRSDVVWLCREVTWCIFCLLQSTKHVAFNNSADEIWRCSPVVKEMLVNSLMVFLLVFGSTWIAEGTRIGWLENHQNPNLRPTTRTSRAPA